MPREAYDADGNLIQGLPDEAELKTLQEAAAAKAELDAKVAEAQKKLEDYEKDPAFKNLGILRKKAEEAEKERDEWKTKYETAVPDSQPKYLSSEEAIKIAESVAEKKFLDKTVNNLLNEFGDKKEVVKKFYEKLSQGEELNEEKVKELVQTAANAAGLISQQTPFVTYHGGGTPKFDNEKSYADTAEGEAKAAALGMIIKPPKQ